MIDRSDTMESNAIEVNNVIIQRGLFKVGPIQLSIPAGYITAIVGPNGSGKTSFFKALMSHIHPREGSITVLGHSNDLTDNIQLKNRIGYLSEDKSNFDDFFTGAKKAELHREWFANWNESLYQNLLKRLSINDSVPLKKMSKGTRRKFEFVLSVSHQPELLLLDEPSSGLDPIAWRSMIDILTEFMDPGHRTILMATHIIDEVKRLADFIVFMVDGKILGIYEKDELLQSWAVYYVQKDAVNEAFIRQVPGLVEFKLIGQDRYEWKTCKALETEEWLKQHQVPIVHKAILELDEILLQHIKKSAQSI